VSGTGGADIGAFSVAITIPEVLTWTNQGSTNVVDRSAGLRINWTGGDPSGFVGILGTSIITTSIGPASMTFGCVAKTSDGGFTVPSLVLQAIPAGPAGVIWVNGVSVSPGFQTRGLDNGIVSIATTSVKGVTFQ
jgi:hypothetical protein